MAFPTGTSGARSSATGAGSADSAAAAATAGRAGGGPPAFAIGTTTADTVNSTSTAETSRLASAWVLPESGTLAGMPTRRSPA